MGVVMRKTKVMAMWVMVVVVSMVMITAKASITDYCANIEYCGDGVECARQAFMCNRFLMGLSRGRRGRIGIGRDLSGYMFGPNKIVKKGDSEDLSPSFFRLL